VPFLARSAAVSTSVIPRQRQPIVVAQHDSPAFAGLQEHCAGCGATRRRARAPAGAAHSGALVSIGSALLKTKHEKTAAVPIGSIGAQGRLSWGGLYPSYAGGPQSQSRRLTDVASCHAGTFSSKKKIWRWACRSCRARRLMAPETRLERQEGRSSTQAGQLGYGAPGRGEKDEMVVVAGSPNQDDAAVAQHCANDAIECKIRALQ